MIASTWPRLTSWPSVKSNCVIVPETCGRTVTVAAGVTVPSASSRTGRSAGVALRCRPWSARRRRRRPPRPPRRRPPARRARAALRPRRRARRRSRRLPQAGGRCVRYQANAPSADQREHGDHGTEPSGAPRRRALGRWQRHGRSGGGMHRWELIHARLLLRLREGYQTNAAPSGANDRRRRKESATGAQQAACPRARVPSRPCPGLTRQSRPKLFFTARSSPSSRTNHRPPSHDEYSHDRPPRRQDRLRHRRGPGHRPRHRRGLRSRRRARDRHRHRRALLADLARATGCETRRLDVTDANAVLAARSRREKGAVDVLFNGAGYVHAGTILDCDETRSTSRSTSTCARCTG